MRRRMWTVALVGLLTTLALCETAEAGKRRKRGGCYAYSGTGGSYGNCGYAQAGGTYGGYGYQPQYSAPPAGNCNTCTAGSGYAPASPYQVQSPGYLPNQGGYAAPVAGYGTPYPMNNAGYAAGYR